MYSTYRLNKMRSKEIGLFVILLFIIFLGIVLFTPEVSAQTTCSSQDQIILRLSSAINAHGEIFDGAGNYSEEICYDTIFGVAGGGDRTCDGNNRVLRLSDMTNAHAEDPGENNYGTDVCYDGLSCVGRSGGCQAGESLVVSLSSSTNAHLSNSAGYGVDICCSLVSIPCSLTNAYWDTLSGSLEVVEGTNVKLIVEGTSTCDGETVSFEVWEDDFPTNDLRDSNPPADVVFNGATATGNWTAEWFDDGFGQGDPEYFFVAATTGDSIDSGGASADELHVIEYDPETDPCANIVVCSDYNNQIDCNNDGCEKAEVSVGSVDCDDPEISCICAWDSGDGECDGAWTGNPGGGCGDGVINPGEQCDGDLDGFSCGNFGFPGGELSCGTDCKFNTSACDGVSGICGNDVINPGETCDDGNWSTILGCSSFDEFDGTGSLSCGTDCQFDTSQCTGGPGDNGGSKIGTCAYDEDTTDNCDDGILTFSWTAVWTWDPSCLDATCRVANQATRNKCKEGFATRSCPAQIPLPFFGAYNFMVSLAIIALIYMLWGSNQGKKKSRKK